jgi:hypothetical protein
MNAGELKTNSVRGEENFRGEYLFTVKINGATVWEIVNSLMICTTCTTHGETNTLTL